MHSMLIVRHGKLMVERYYGNHHAGNESLKLPSHTLYRQIIVS
ncbi:MULTISPECIES: hypothetical protein [unclassified Paenibacillus]|nr:MULTISPECIES: hypothetical protein [unclassified Paenibacillus]MDF9843399.1 hypothetical protein [Paenibacillus sp. PastF-2]MDH6481965.1 hypothetical protein [Paenibacillus sp. PastH-2]